MKAVLLILDGLGVGAMPDAGRQGFPNDADTLRHVAEAVDDFSLPIFSRLGLGNVASVPGVRPHPTPAASHGRSALAYQGADSYLGHQEVMGTIPPSPRGTLLADVVHEVEHCLHAAGHEVARSMSDGPLLVIDGAAVIGDNLEAASGQAINVTVPTSALPFDAAVGIARSVRAVVHNSRVIVCGGPSVTLDDILVAVESHSSGQVGVNTPKLGIYDDDYVVQHLGLGGDPERQIPSHFGSAGLPVALFGKVADLVEGEVDLRSPTVSTSALLEELTQWTVATSHGFAAATVQETDLAGHEEDPFRYADVLRTVDDLLPRILDTLDARDVLAITADHGNDPVLGGGQHTREYVPLLWYQPAAAARTLGDRRSLADVPASLAAHARIGWSSGGTSFVS